MNGQVAKRLALTQKQIEEVGMSSLAGFFYAWLALHRRPEAKEAALSGDEDEQTVADAIIDAQTAVMNIAQRVPAASFEDFAFKLAVWRWDAALKYEEMDRGERIVYSAFLDLIEFTGLHSLYTEEDFRVRELLVAEAA